MVLAAIHSQLGNRVEAERALREMLALRPDFGAVARRELENFFFEPEVAELFLEGLRKAGLFDQATPAAPNL